MDQGGTVISATAALQNFQIRLTPTIIIIIIIPHRWCLHLIVVVVFECSWDPESYAGGSIATGRITHTGQVKG
jgi:hypothetical protein